MSYPALTNLGINRPHEISSYTISSRNGVDTLRIKYTRQKGSLLPTTKRFQFPRRPTPGAPHQTEFTEISPALEAALDELAQLLDRELSQADKKEALLEELDEFRDFINQRIDEFKTEIKKL